MRKQLPAPPKRSLLKNLSGENDTISSLPAYLLLRRREVNRHGGFYFVPNLCHGRCDCQSYLQLARQRKEQVASQKGVDLPIPPFSMEANFNNRNRMYRNNI